MSPVDNIRSLTQVTPGADPDDDLGLDERDIRQLLDALAMVARQKGVYLPSRLLERHPEVAQFEQQPEKTAKAASRCVKQMALQYGLDVVPLAGVKTEHLFKMQRLLPIVLLLRGGQSLVLKRVEELPTGEVSATGRSYRFVLVDPVVGQDVPLVLDAATLERAWDGELLYVKIKDNDSSSEAEQQTFGMRWLLDRLYEEKTTLRDIVCAALALAFLSLVPIMFMRLVLDRVLHHNSHQTFATLCVFLVVFTGCEAVLVYLRRLAVLFLSARVDAKLSSYAFNRVLRLPLSFFETHQVGTIARDLGETNRIRALLTGQLLATVVDMIGIVVFLPIMFLLHPILTAWVLMICGLIVMFLLVMLPRVRLRAREVFHAEGRKSAFLVETLRGIHTVKSLALEGRQRQEWERRVASLIRLRLHEGTLISAVQASVLPLERSMTTGAIAVGTWIVLSSGESAYVGALVGFLLLANRVASPLIQISYLLQQFDEARLAVGTVERLLNRPTEDDAGRDGLRTSLEGSVEFQGVTFAYPEAQTAALNNVSFTVPDGGVLAIVGRSGSGKTTVTRLLQRLNTNYDGFVKINGAEIREFDLDHLRTNMGVVPQESFLFSGSIRDNIAIGAPEASLERVIEAAKIAGADEFISEFPRGYDTPLQEGGANLSGGQRQRIAIARAIIRDPQILLFDEATSALDAESEAVLNANLPRIAAGRTVIIISHRLSSIIKADSILVLERGRVLDQGTHEELLERCDVYASLWKRQNPGFERQPRKQITRVLPLSNSSSAANS